jgi:hypothetical protein
MEFDGDNAHKTTPKNTSINLLKANYSKHDPRPKSTNSGLNFSREKRFNMKDHGAALSRLANQAPFVNLTPEQEQRVLKLIEEIGNIFNQQVQKAS